MEATKRSSSRNKKKPQCFACSSKLGALLMVCRCEKIFCSQHIQPEYHECPLLEEIRAAEREQLKKKIVDSATRKGFHMQDKL